MDTPRIIWKIRTFDDGGFFLSKSLEKQNSLYTIEDNVSWTINATITPYSKYTQISDCNRVCMCLQKLLYLTLSFIGEGQISCKEKWLHNQNDLDGGIL